MLTLIPAPKKCTVTNESLHAIPLAVISAREEWRTFAKTFCESFSAAHETRIRYGAEDGIELHFDGSLAENAYRIETAGALRIYASADEGVLYGLATALQLSVVKNEEILVPTLVIEDAPDKDYRAIMVDLGREWHPFDKLLKHVELCFFYKIRYLNLHFADTRIYTLPSKAFPKLCKEGRYYTEEEIAFLRKYAAARGVVIVPEFECPGHAPILNTHYPEVFGDRSDGDGGVFYNESGEVIDNKSLLCASRESAVEGVKTLIREICELFPESPYLHIGGDEANIALWDQCADCRAYMKEHGIDGVYGLYSDYVARIASYVLSLGKTPMVWEGFPEEGADKIPSETIVFSWENHYQTTHQLLKEGFRIINSSWKPLYIVPSNTVPSERLEWNAKDILDWNVYNWQHWWPQSEAALNPINIEPTEQVIGAMMCAWEMTFEQEIAHVMSHLAALAERTWTVKRVRDYDSYRMAFKRLYMLSARLIRDV